MSQPGRVGYLLLGGVASVAIAAALLAGLGSGARAEGKDEQQQVEKTAEKRSLPETMKRMKYINEALGVDCDYCHVPNKFEIETPRKKTARWMQEHMVDGLVTKEGMRPIDCRTCHEGRARFLPSSQ